MIHCSRPSSTCTRLVQVWDAPLETETTYVPEANEKRRGVIHLGLLSPLMVIRALLILDSTTSLPLPGAYPRSGGECAACKPLVVRLSFRGELSLVPGTTELMPAAAEECASDAAGAGLSLLDAGIPKLDRFSKEPAWTPGKPVTTGVETGVGVTSPYFGLVAPPPANCFKESNPDLSQDPVHRQTKSAANPINTNGRAVCFDE